MVSWLNEVGDQQSEYTPQTFIYIYIYYLAWVWRRCGGMTGRLVG